MVVQIISKKIFSALSMALFCTVASAAAPSLNEPFDAASLSLIGPHPAHRAAASEKATSFAKGSHPAHEGRELDASKAGLSPSDQSAINDAMSPVAKNDGYALMLSGLGMILMLVVRRRRLD